MTKVNYYLLSNYYTFVFSIFYFNFKRIMNFKLNSLSIFSFPKVRTCGNRSIYLLQPITLSFLIYNKNYSVISKMKRLSKGTNLLEVLLSAEDDRHKKLFTISAESVSDQVTP